MAWLLGGGGDSLDRDDVLSRVVTAIAKLGVVGARGREQYPVAVHVTLGVPEEHHAVVLAYTKQSDFDKEVRNRLLNRMSQHDPSRLPVVLYEVLVATALEIHAAPEASPPVLTFRIDGGDRDGETVGVPVRRGFIHVGRSRGHGDSATVINEVVVTHTDMCVSRAAARLRFSGVDLEIESRDQGSALVVIGPAGREVRPANTAKGWYPVKTGDVVGFSDGHEIRIRLHIGDFGAAVDHEASSVDPQDAITERIKQEIEP